MQAKKTRIFLTTNKEVFTDLTDDDHTNRACSLSVAGLLTNKTNGD